MEGLDRNIASSARRAALRGLGIRLRTARTNAGLTQERVAVQLKVSAQAVRNWESGRNEPKGQAIRDMAALYGVARQKLQEGDPEDSTEHRTPAQDGRVLVDITRLKAARQASGLSQREAAERSGLNLSSIRRYEQGNARPTVTTLRKLAFLYGSPARWFLAEEPNHQHGDAITGNPMPMDEALRAYRIVQPELTTGSMRTIADFIMFVHRQQLSRTKSLDSCTETDQVSF